MPDPEAGPAFDRRTRFGEEEGDLSEGIEGGRRRSGLEGEPPPRVAAWDGTPALEVPDLVRADAAADAVTPALPGGRVSEGPCGGGPPAWPGAAAAH